MEFEERGVNLPQKLLESSEKDFLGLVQQLGRLGGVPAGIRVAIAADFAALLIEAPFGRLEQGRRFQSIVSTLQLGDEGTHALVNAIGGLPTSVKNTLARAIPNELHPILYQETMPIPGQGNASSSNPIVVTPTSAQPDQVEILPENGTVVLVSSVDNQTGNRSLLRERGFGGLRAANTDELDRLLGNNPDVCAVLIDGSILGTLSTDEQKELFRKIASYSTFLWIRIDETNISLSRDEVQATLKREWCRKEDISFNQISFSPNGVLHVREIAHIEAASTLLSTIQRSSFIPGELGDDQAATLMAAAAHYGRDWQSVPALDVISLRTRFLIGGRTSARVALLKVNDRIDPFVAKIDEKDSIRQEILRFRVFIESWDPQLHPSVYMHNSCGVIVFGLVSDESSPAEPAPSLEARIRRLWESEIYGLAEGVVAPNHEELVKAITIASEKLLRLNQIPATNPDFVCFAYPAVSAFERLESTGIDLGFSEGARRAREIAKKRFNLLQHSATVHGDVNLRNILLGGDRFAYFIDYASSGPGHPSIDLIRLELSLYLGAFQQSGPEQSCTELQHAISVERATYADLVQEFPGLVRSLTNQVCIRGSIAARDNAIAAVESHNGDYRDYIAAKYMAAWVSLTMEGYNTSLSRGVIESLIMEILSWEAKAVEDL